MASSGNFATWNPLTIGSRASLADGNLTIKASTIDLVGVTSTIGITSGKWYWEIYIARGYDTFMYAGISSGYEGGGFYAGYSDLNGMTPSAIRIRNNGTLHDSSAQDSPDRWGTITLNSTNVQTFDDTDILMFALDYDNKKLWIGKNGTFMNSGNPAGGSNQQASWTGDVPIIYPVAEPYYTNNNETANFGQDSSFAGKKTSGSANATDANGFGNFYYTPPSSGDTKFLALCSANLPISADIDPAQTDTDFPQKQFNTITYTGNGSDGNSISGVGFQPDFVWVKSRSGSNAHQMYDSNRGTGKLLSSNNTDSEQTYSSVLQSFDSDGFTAGTSGGINGSGNNLVAWCWKANGGTTASNGNGSITATVQANTAAGFSIATYTSPGSGTNHTVGHGLSGVDFIITKDRDSTFNWYCFHKSVPDKTYRLNSGSEHSYANWSMGSTTWGSEDGYTHNSTDKFVAYCWQNVSGMQHFGSYIGNGNSDGPFVYLGFRPALLVLKRTTSDGFWNVFDSGRKTFNSSSNPYLVWNNTDVEANGVPIDFLSNGFKVRSSGSGVNSDGNTMIYMAWGSVPFKYNNAF